MTASVCHQQKKTIQSNAASLQRRLHKEYLETKRRIQEAEEKRLGIVLGEELEALRQWQELNRVRIYLRRVRSQLSAVEFIDMASRTSEMMSRMLKQFRMEKGSEVVVRENEEKLRLIGGSWKVVGEDYEGGAEDSVDHDHDHDDDDNNVVLALEKRDDEEIAAIQYTSSSSSSSSSHVVAVPDVCRNVKHTVQNQIELNETKLDFAKCSCSGLWRYYVLRNTEGSCKRMYENMKCRLRKARITIDLEKIPVEFPCNNDTKMSITDDDDDEDDSDELKFWKSSMDLLQGNEEEKRSNLLG